MKYLHRFFKAKKGTHVKVHFDQPTRVLLIGDYNYRQYKEHRTFSYHGGLLDDSPHEFRVPSDGIWHVVIERGGYYNPKNIHASVEVVPSS
jgi:hypothetical protein